MEEKAKKLDFAQKMKTARAAAGVSQLNLSAATGISQPWISRYENTDANPTYQTMCQIAEALGCTIEFVPKKK